MDELTDKAFIDAFAQRVIERAQRNLGAQRTIGGKKRRRVSSGFLKDNLTFQVKPLKSGPEIRFGARGKAKDYMDVIERGRRPGSKQPPIDAILQWMKVKPIRLQKKGGGFVKSTPSAIRSAAFLIARSIGKKGIQGIYYYKEAIEDELADSTPEFNQQLTEAINRMVARLNAKAK